MVLALLMSLMVAPAYAAPNRSPSRDDTIVDELPDPNDPDSPDYVTIIDDDIPMGYVKVPDGENGYIYVPEDEVDILDPDTPMGELPDDILDGDVPMGEGPDDADIGSTGVKSPQTGESSADVVLMMAGMACTAALLAAVAGKKKAVG